MGNYCISNNNVLNDKILNDTKNLEIADSNIPKFSLNSFYMLGKVVYVYDGDTVHIVFNLNNKLIKFNCRLILIDSPEICPKNIKDLNIRNEEIKSAIKSRNYLIDQISNKPIINSIMTKYEIKELCAKSTKLIWVKCFDFDKYGRLLVELYNTKDAQVSINQLMIDNKYAQSYDGGTKKEFFS
jgi:endonuclease YncB( thermonuclease family)